MYEIVICVLTAIYVVGIVGALACARRHHHRSHPLARPRATRRAE